MRIRITEQRGRLAGGMSGNGESPGLAIGDRRDRALAAIR
jgi:hypothetical protein